MDNPISFASAALRSPAGPAWGGLRLKNPVVHDERARRQPEASAASTAAAADDGGTPYTPGPRRGEGPRPLPPEGPGRGPGRSSSAIASYQAVSQSLSYERSDSFDLSIRTTEGDVARIHIAQAHSESIGVAAGRYDAPGSQGAALALSNSSSDSLKLEISVAGDLSDAETASINALLQKVQGVADDFFAGNQTQAATAAASLDLGSDNSTLGAFSFELQSRLSLHAVATYESVATATAPAAATVPALPQAGPSTDASTGATGADFAAAIPPRGGDFLQQVLSMFEDFARSAKELAGSAGGEDAKPLAAASGSAAAAAAAPNPAQPVVPDLAV